MFPFLLNVPKTAAIYSKTYMIIKQCMSVLSITMYSEIVMNDWFVYS